MKKETIIKILVCLFIAISFYVIGFGVGSIATAYGVMQIIQSFDIEELNIDLNETQLAEASMLFAFKINPDLAKINNNTDYFPEWEGEKKEPLVLIK